MKHKSLMDIRKVQVHVSYNGEWDEISSECYNYVGGRTKGILIDKDNNILLMKEKIGRISN